MIAGKGLIALIVGVIAAAIAFATGEDEAKAAPAGPKPRAPLPPSPLTKDPAAAAALDKIAQSGDPKKIEAAAEAARSAGDPKLAAVLDQRATGAKIASPQARFVSPFPNDARVTDQVWDKFVKIFKGTNAAAVGPYNQLGLFGFTYPRLSDLGLVDVKSLRSIKKGDRTVKTGTFVAPLTEAKFLADPVVQYEVFKKHVAALGSALLKKYPTVIDKTTIEGKPVTLSGLIAVAHRAGLGALDQWLKDPAMRKQHPGTMKEFQAATGLF